VSTAPPNPPSNPPPSPPQPPYADYANYAQYQAYANSQHYARNAARTAQRAQRRAMRCHSIVGPLLLIAIGTIILLMNFHLLDSTRFWDFYRQGWPLILISIGIVMAAESLLMSRWRHCSTRVGGAVFLTILLLGLGMVAAYVSHVNWPAIQSQLGMDDGMHMLQIFGQKHQATQQLTLPVTLGGVVVIQNPHGDVTVNAGANTPANSQMYLTLDKTIYANSDSRAQQKLDALQAVAVNTGNITTLRLNTSDSASADLTLTLPPNVAVEVHSQYGDVTVSGRQAAVTVHSDHGDVHLDTIAAPVQATLQRGDFSAHDIQNSVTLNGRMNDVTLSNIQGAVTMDGDFFGDLHLEHLAAPIHFHSSRTKMEFARIGGSIVLDSGDLTVNNAVGPATVATRAKDIALTGITGDVHLRNSDGNITLTAAQPMGNLDVENHKGAIDITVPANAKFSVEASADDGEIHTDFPLTTENGDHHDTVSGSVNGGGPRLRLTTEKGDITLHKADGAAKN